MAFRLSLDQDVVPVEPGATAPLTVTVVGDPESADRYELEVEGVDPEWKAIPVPIFSTEPGESISEKLFFKPPRASESGAGNYPFVVRVRSLESGESKTAQGILKVTPYYHLSAELSPKKGYFSPLRHQNEFDLSLVNLGNRTLPLQLSATDPEDACAYVFEQENVEVGPGQQVDLPVRVNPRRNPILASGRLIGFTVTARATDANHVATHAQAQLEQRAFLSPVSLGGIVLLLALAGGWWASRPQKPSITIFADPAAVTQGDSIKITWNAPVGSKVHVETEKGDVIYDGTVNSGNRTYKVDSTGTLVFTATVERDGLKAEAQPITVTSTAPVVAPSPVIASFTAEPERVLLGQPVTLRYRFNDAVTEAKLAPTNQELDPALSSIEVRPEKVGTSEYEIVARNKDGRETKRTVKVSVYDESAAQILAFSATPKKVAFPGDPTIIRWQSNAKTVRVEMKVGNEPFEQVELTGERQFIVNEKTLIQLVAVDDAGKRTPIQKVTVDIEPQTPPPTGPTDGGDLPPSTLTTGGTNGVTSGPDPIPPRTTGGR